MRSLTPREQALAEIEALKTMEVNSLLCDYNLYCRSDVPGCIMERYAFYHGLEYLYYPEGNSEEFNLNRKVKEHLRATEREVSRVTVYNDRGLPNEAESLLAYLIEMRITHANT